MGPQVLRVAEAIGTGWQCRALRIAVIDTNPRAFEFWKREGFIELLRKPAMDFDAQAIIMKRALPAYLPKADLARSRCIRRLCLSSTSAGHERPLDSVADAGGNQTFVTPPDVPMTIPRPVALVTGLTSSIGAAVARRLSGNRFSTDRSVYLGAI